MDEYYVNNNVNLLKAEHTDLVIEEAGFQSCPPGHSPEGKIRISYVIHYIDKGTGTFECNGKVYKLGKGDGFILFPHIYADYYADMEAPWTYRWVGFYGIKADLYLQKANLSPNNPVFKYTHDDFLDSCFSDILSAKKVPHGREMRMLGHLYILLSKLLEVNHQPDLPGKESCKTQYIRKAIDFMTTNYSQDITISRIASFIGLDRKYFSSIFKDILEVSPQEFLINYRINRACSLLGGNGSTVSEICHSVGYEDPAVFSRIFKKTKGMSPREYKRFLSLAPEKTLPPNWDSTSVIPTNMPSIYCPQEFYSKYSKGALIIKAPGGGSYFLDVFMFAYTISKGDFSISTRVTSLENTHEYAKAGIMVRKSLNPDCDFIFISLLPDGTPCFLLYRNSELIPVSTSVKKVKFPCYLKLERRSDQYIAYYKQESSDWQYLGVIKLETLPAEVYTGLSASAYKYGSICTAVFEDMYFLENF